MATITGGTKVDGGFYWDRTARELRVIPSGGGTLPGDAARRFVRVPALALLLLGPIAGGFYVILLPFVGVYLLGRNLFALATRASRRAAKTSEGTRKI